MSRFKVTFPGNKKVDVAFKEFEIKTDQTKKNEGDETAPEPFALFLSSLGACAGIYAKSFCDTRNIDSSGMLLFLDVSFKKGQKFMDQVNITLHVNQQFPEKYIKPIIKTMNGCAVKNQLHPDIKTQTTVAYLDQ
ncbi:MAG: OsmC family protein [Proteobacteria bacterium]|nr:OsmC family protein [Pseudomonadota bacterium]MBU1582739.1 OsmC family protein [Pseudomonadota bacterium]MBU2451843.1 OsmC family protein [Pseudomonadota bacterium]